MDSSPVPLELAVVIPVFNERENVHPVLENLAKALLGIKYEVIFVDDDSADGTADCIRAVARCDPYIRVLQRISRRGLASACLEGMMSTASPYIAVMDADLQRDERILPQMHRDSLAEWTLPRFVGEAHSQNTSMKRPERSGDFDPCDGSLQDLLRRARNLCGGLRLRLAICLAEFEFTFRT